MENTVYDSISDTADKNTCEFKDKLSWGILIHTYYSSNSQRDYEFEVDLENTVRPFHNNKTKPKTRCNNVWDNFQQSNTCVTKVQKGGVRAGYLKQSKIWKFSKFHLNRNSKNSSKRNSKKTIPAYYDQVPKMCNKEKSLKSPGKKDTLCKDITEKNNRFPVRNNATQKIPEQHF